MYKIIVLLLIGINIYADEAKFTLEDAIRIAKTSNYEQKNILENIKKNNLNINQNNSYYLPNISINSRFGKEVNSNEIIKDNFSYLVVKNKLFSNNTEIVIDELKNNIENQKLLLKNSIKNSKIKAMKLFLAASLAEYYQQYILEFLTMSAIKNFHANDYYSTGRVSDLEILETKTNMEFESAKKLEAESAYEESRQSLANYLNLDIAKVYYLKKPNLTAYWEKTIPEVEIVQKKVIENDIILKSKKQSLQTIAHKINQLTHNNNIELGSVLKYGVEPQATVNDNDTRWEARVELKINLYDSGVTKNKLENLFIEKSKLQNEISQYKLDLNYKVLKLVNTLLHYKKMNTAYSTQVDYRTLYLDKARVNYELDRQSDLGDSMKEMTKAEYQYAKNEYNYVVTYEMLALLMGE